MHLESVTAGGIRGGVLCASTLTGTGCSCGVGNSNRSREVVVGCGVVRGRTCHRNFRRSVIRLAVPVLRAVLDMIGMTDRHDKGSCFLRFGECCRLRRRRLRFIDTGDYHTGKRGIIVNRNGDIGDFTCGGSCVRSVCRIARQVVNALYGIRESGKIILFTLGESAHRKGCVDIRAEIGVVYHERSLRGLCRITSIAHANHYTAHRTNQIVVRVIAVGGFLELQADTGRGKRVCDKAPHVVRGLPDFLQQTVNSPFCFCPRHLHYLLCDV